MKKIVPIVVIMAIMLSLYLFFIVPVGNAKEIIYNGDKYYRDDALILENVIVTDNNGTNASYNDCLKIQVRDQDSKKRDVWLYKDDRFIFDGRFWFIKGGVNSYPEFSLDNIKKLKIEFREAQKCYELNFEQLKEFYFTVQKLIGYSGSKMVIDENTDTSILGHALVAFNNFPENIYFEIFIIVFYESNFLIWGDEDFGFGKGSLEVENTQWSRDVYNFLQTDIAQV